MKFSKLSQLFLVSTIGLVVAVFLAGCQLVTIDYVFVASSSGSGNNSTGQIQTFAVDSESGALRQGAPTVSTGGVGPITMAVTGNYYHLYVANATSKTVVHFSIATNGTLTAADTITLAAAPVGLAVNQANTYLYVVSGTTSATLSEYPISTTGVIGVCGLDAGAHGSRFHRRHDGSDCRERAGEQQLCLRGSLRSFGV